MIRKIFIVFSVVLNVILLSWLGVLYHGDKILDYEHQLNTKAIKAHQLERGIANE